MTKIYVFTAISSCDNAYEGDPINIDAQKVFTDYDAAKKELYSVFNEYLEYDGEYGEVLSDETELTDDFFKVVLYDDGNSTTIYQGEIKEYEV